MNYLYNGIELPELSPPEGYSNLVIRESIFNIGVEYYAYAFMEPYRYDSDEMGFVASKSETYFHAFGSTAEDDWSAWVEDESATNLEFIKLSRIVWSNFDILNEDGTLYLAASDPIPVGSAPEVDPKSFMAGWRMGQIVRAMR